MMSTKEVADKYVEYGRMGQWDKAQEELYADSCASLEMEGVQGFPQRVEGMEAIKMKGKHWEDMVETFHGMELEGPLVAGNHFTVSMKMDVTMKGQERRTDEEVAVFEVKDGKIVTERFFYPLG